MNTQDNFLQTLHRSLNERQRPEDIAMLILENRDDLSDRERKILQKAAKGSLKNAVYQWFSSMPTKFQEPFGMRKQIEKAKELFDVSFGLNESDFTDTQQIENFLKELNALIGKTPGNSDFKNDRLNAEDRQKHGIDLSRRQYNKLFRHTARLEAKLTTLIREQQKLRFTKISKTSLASEITWIDFKQDIPSACFVAYYAARAYRRSVFTAYGQEKAYDEIADMLYENATERPAANWWVIAHTYPKQEVVNRLTDEQKGALLGEWTSIIQDIAKLLEEVWLRSDINRETMVVRRGNDSSTWNQTAGAWNKARDSWMALIYSLGLEGILDHVCFGKVMRLMAADVVAWHRAEGGDIDPDTKVWSEIPLPWQVFNGEAHCSIDKVRQVCTGYGVDPEKSGWITPRPRTHIEQYNPTPELVHGVVVESPFLAKLLRDAGFFSGKTKGLKNIGDPDAANGLHDEIIQKHIDGLNAE